MSLLYLVPVRGLGNALLQSCLTHQWPICHQQRLYYLGQYLVRYVSITVNVVRLTKWKLIILLTILYWHFSRRLLWHFWIFHHLKTKTEYESGKYDWSTFIDFFASNPQIYWWYFVLFNNMQAPFAYFRYHVKLFNKVQSFDKITIFVWQWITTFFTF